jgi:ribosomal protein L37E
MYEETGWVKGLRVVAWINLISGIISAFVTANQLSTMFVDWGQDRNWGIFFITLIAVCILTFITTAVIMVLLDMATDISITKQINFDMLKTLQKGDVTSSDTTSGSVKTAKSIVCSSCNKTYDTSYNSCPHCGYRSKESKPSLSSIAAKSSASFGGFWMCKECDEKNPSSSRICKGCGKYK